MNGRLEDRMRAKPLVSSAAIFAPWPAPPSAMSTLSAAPAAHRFDVAAAAAKKGRNVSPHAGLIYIPTGKPASNAVISCARLDMSPGSIAGMTATAQSKPAVSR